MRYQRYLTIVYAVPPGWDVGVLTSHEYASAFAWSHKMDECNGLKAECERLKSELSFAQAERDEVMDELRRMPDLSPVIAWLENGCDPKEAAKELHIYQQRIRF